MTILFVAFPSSIHTSRWLSQLKDTGWDIHLFSSMPGKMPHEEIEGITFHENFYILPATPGKGYKFCSIGLPALSFIRNSTFKKIIQKFLAVTGIEKKRDDQLTKVIKSIRPDIIHSFETQHSGYLLSRVKENYKEKFPLWIHSNWGIDLHFFGQLEEHILPIRKTLSLIDVFITEGKRDEILARSFGFAGNMYTFYSVGGGFFFPPVFGAKPSARKKILVKGTQDLVRRGLVAMRALERCVDVLADYDIVLYSSNDITQVAAETFFFRTGKRIFVLDEISHVEMLQLNAEARLNICVNMSDGMPNSMLEAMMMGAFPIQSDTSLADEFIVHEKNGMIVPPEDPDIIEAAIRKALMDDAMVDNAAEINRKIVSEKLNYTKIQKAVTNMYLNSINLHKAYYASKI